MLTEARGRHRAWIEVDHDALRHNVATIRRLAGDASLIGVVKANAYGHGDLAVARTLVAEGAERLAVATVDEAARLRAADIGVPILLLWGVGPAEARHAAELGLETIVAEPRDVAQLEEAAAAAGRRARVQLKIDTGLGRQGSAPAAALDLAALVAHSRWLELAGTFSHLAVPGEDDAYTDVQLVRLARLLDGMRSAGIDPGLVHVSGTGGLLAGAGTFADAVRPGLALYGMLPGWAYQRDPGLRPILSLKARAQRIFGLTTGEAVGYGLRHRAARPATLATLPIGYGDGWPRVHANNGSAVVRGQRVPIVGAVSMDGISVDVTEVDGVTYADEFVLIGEQDGVRISADDVAAERRTINYEVTTALRDRLPRLHLGAGT